MYTDLRFKSFWLNYFQFRRFRYKRHLGWTAFTVVRLGVSDFIVNPFCVGIWNLAGGVEMQGRDRRNNLRILVIRRLSSHWVYSSTHPEKNSFSELTSFSVKELSFREIRRMRVISFFRIYSIYSVLFIIFSFSSIESIVLNVTSFPNGSFCKHRSQ
jgi:hypothetical protein